MPISAIKNVSFTSPFDDEAHAVERRRQFAQALQSQAMTPIEAPPPAGGWAVPISPWQGAAKLAQSAVAGMAMNRADRDRQELSKRYSSTLADTLRRGQEAMAGRQARTINPDPQEFEQSSDFGTPTPQAANIPAQAPDLGRAASVYLEHPATLPLGIQMAGQQAQTARTQALLAQALRGGQGQPAQSQPVGVSDSSAAGLDAPWAAASSLPQAQAQQGSPFPGVNPMAAQFLMSGDPTLTTIGKTIQDANKPTDKIREAIALGYQPGTPAFNAFVGTQFTQGGAWQPDGQGGYRLAPGYARGAGDIKSAEAGATAAYDLIPVPVAGGGTQLMPRSIAAQRLGGGAPMAQPQQSVQGQGGALPIPQAPQGLTLPQAQGGRLGYQQSEAGRASERTLAEGRAKDALEQSVKFRDAWGTASERLNQMDLLEQLFSDPNVASGGFAESISSLKGFADSLGIKTEGKMAEDVLAAITSEMALKMRLQGGQNLMPGQMSNFEQKLLRSMVPMLAQSRDGRMLMVQVFRAKAQRDMQLAEMAAQYEDQNGKLDSGFYRQARQFVAANPMFDQQTINGMIERADSLTGSGRRPAQSNYTQEDLQYTAQQHGISVDEVKRRLGLR